LQYFVADLGPHQAAALGCANIGGLPALYVPETFRHFKLRQLHAW
jgi:hypothetical protein